MKKLLFAILFLGLGLRVSAQELNFTVIINSDRARIQNTNIFDQMKTS
nr:DUF4835 domain-containing protein [Algoriphagus sp.]